MTDFESLPDGWTVWSDEPNGRSVLAYRPDVFDTGEFPAPCLPTLYLTEGPARGRRPRARVAERRADHWSVMLYLEPEVGLPSERRFDSREAAVEGAVELAREFSRGDVDYRALYQVPREAYLDRLDELVGRDV